MHAATTRWHEYHKRFGQSDRPVKVQSASYFGGEGTEWLCGGGFLNNGELILAGSSLGPELQLPGTKVRVLGRDGSTLGPLDEKAMRDKKGDLEIGYNSLKGTRSTGFITRLGENLKPVQSAVRLPWGSGAITDCVLDKEDCIYNRPLRAAVFGHRQGPAARRW